MAALTQDRNTPERSGDRREPPVKGATLIYAGGMVGIDAAGHAVPMATATGLKSIGRADRRADNRDGANGAIRVPVRAGIFRFANSAAADAIALDDIGANCFAVDDQTVALTNGTNTRSIAGVIFDVDDEGVWVKIV